MEHLDGRLEKTLCFRRFRRTRFFISFCPECISVSCLLSLFVCIVHEHLLVVYISMDFFSHPTMLLRYTFIVENYIDDSIVLCYLLVGIEHTNNYCFYSVNRMHWHCFIHDGHYTDRYCVTVFFSATTFGCVSITMHSISLLLFLSCYLFKHF